MPTKNSAPAVYSRVPLLRAHNGWSQKQLADIVGVHFQTIGSLERGEYNPSLKLALTIAAAFKLPVEDVFALTPFHTSTPEHPPATRPTPSA